jgi:hypothetical protein
MAMCSASAWRCKRRPFARWTPSVARLEGICAKFGVATLIECMLLRTLELRVEVDRATEFGQTEHRFFDRARGHSDADDKLILSQIAAAPTESSDRSYRPVLEQCPRPLRQEPGALWPEPSVDGHRRLWRLV